METLKIGLVGTGGIGRSHIERINNRRFLSVLASLFNILCTFVVKN